MVELVYLDNQEHLRAVDKGSSDMVPFLRMKARSGDVESQVPSSTLRVFSIHFISTFVRRKRKNNISLSVR